jgi:hypothetical protein
MGGAPVVQRRGIHEGRDAMKKLLFAALILSAPIALHAQHEGHAMHAGGAMDMGAGPAPKEGGQAAFAALTEMVTMLEADPRTDWSKVSIDRLREHLIDMDNVALHARATAVPVPGGMRFAVVGDGPVRESIRRMARDHAAFMNGQGGRRETAADSEDGAILTVTADTPAEAQKIRALGAFGLLAEGSHHQAHHLMMAKGEMVH